MDENADNLHNMGVQTLKFSCENIEVFLSRAFTGRCNRRVDFVFFVKPVKRRIKRFIRCSASSR